MPRFPRFRRRLGCCSLVVLACACSGPAQPEPDTDPPPGPVATGTPTRVSVDLATVLGTLDGFGSYTLPLVYPPGDYLGTYRSAALEAVYGEVGLNLGFLSQGVTETPLGAADPWTARRNDNGDPSFMDPAGFDWSSIETMQSAVVSPAAAHGYDDLTPGYVLNLLGHVSWLEGVRAQDYTRYLAEAAEHVLGVVRGWEQTTGRVPQRLHLFNEPTTGNRELRSSSVSEQVDLVAAVGGRLAAEGYGDIRFIVPNEETPARGLEVARALLQDPRSRPYVGVVGFHPYPYGSPYASTRRILDESGSGTPNAGAMAELEAFRNLAAQYSVPVWLTETTEGPARNDFPFGSVENVLARAIHIHDVFAYAGASAYFGMNTLWDSRSHEEHFAGRNVPFLSELSTMALVDLDDGAVRLTGMARAVGHYARWTEPGDSRVEASTDHPRVFATAFHDPGSSRLAVVLVNNTGEERAVTLDIDGGSAGGAVSGEVSSGVERWTAIPSYLPDAAGNVTVTSPPRSVVTVAIPIG